MKKIKNMKLMLLGLLAMGSVNAFAEDYVYYDNMVYQVVDGTKTVKFYGLSANATGYNVNEKIVIPRTISTNAPGNGAVTTYTVVGLVPGWPGAQSSGTTWATQAFTTTVKTLEINFTIREDAVKKEAFYPLTLADFTSLESFKVSDVRMMAALPKINVALKDKLKKIDVDGVSNDKDPVAIPANWADGFTALTDVNLPNAEVTIGDNAFNDCTALKTIDLATTKVTSIGASAFQSCGALLSITIPEDVEAIGTDAFRSVWSATSIDFKSNKMETIPSDVFTKDTNVEKLTVTSSSVKTIAASAFATSDDLETIDLSGTPALNKIEAGAFATDLKKLKKVDLRNTQLTAPITFGTGTAIQAYYFGEKLTSIPSFNGCTSLSKINEIPAGVKTIANNGFYQVKGGVDVDDDKAKDYVTKITFAANSQLESIGESAFEECTSLQEIDLTNTTKLATLGKKAFKHASALKSIDFSKTLVTTIPESAFEMGRTDASETTSGAVQNYKGEWHTYQTALTKVVLLDITDMDASKYDKFTIGDKAFYFCNKLETVENLNQARLASIGKRAFTLCNYKGTLDLSKANTKDGSSYIFTTIPELAFQDNHALTSVVLPEGITTIDEAAFKNCKTLFEITYNGIENLQKIGETAFRLTALTKVDLKGATNKAFTTIPEYAFGEISTLKTVELPAQISEIADMAFCFDTNLESINLNQTSITTLNRLFSTKKNKDEISLDKLTSLELVKSTELKDEDGKQIVLPEITNIADYALQFTGLKEIVIPESVEILGKGAFRACTNLEKFTWKNVKTMTTLPDNCFQGDINLKEVYFLTTATSEVIKDAEVFFMCDKDQLKVYLTPDSYNKTVAEGYGNDNRQYSTLDIMGNKVFEFTKSNLSKSDNYYYATYYNMANSSWFDANEFDVFSAVVEGNKVVLKKATADGGYYKVAKFVSGTNDAKALCIVRSKNMEAKPELNSNAGSDALSTLPSENDLTYVKAVDGVKASKLKYQYKLGRKDGVVAFYHITSGNFKQGTLYIEATAPGAARLNIVVEGEGEVTGIESLFGEEAAQDDAPVYNLQGARVSGAQKGIYIKNGKKFIVK